MRGVVLMHKYNGDEVHNTNQFGRVKILSVINDNGFVGYDVELIDLQHKTLHNIARDQLEHILFS